MLEQHFGRKKESVRDFVSKPIPEFPDISGWREVPIIENGEQLVPVGRFSNYPLIWTSATYYGERNESPYRVGELGGWLGTYMRESVANALTNAQLKLPDDLGIVVFDAYRPLKVQAALREMFEDELRGLHSDWNPEKLESEANKYVSRPSKNPPSQHYTGGVVDLALYQISDNQILKRLGKLKPVFIKNLDGMELYEATMEREDILRRNASLLDFGTAFDFGGKQAGTRYFEETPGEVRDNRRILYWLMQSVGLVGYPHEWWEAKSPKVQLGAIVSGKTEAEFGGVELSDYNLWFEDILRKNMKGNLDMYRGIRGDSKLGIIGEHGTVLDIAQKYGEMNRSRLQVAEKIKPK